MSPRCYQPREVFLKETHNESSIRIGNCCEDYGIELKPFWVYFLVPVFAEIVLIFYNETVSASDAIYKEPTDYATLVFLGYTILNLGFILAEFDYSAAEDRWEVYEGIVFLFANSTAAISLLVSFQHIMVRRGFPSILKIVRFSAGPGCYDFRVFGAFEEGEGWNTNLRKGASEVKFNKSNVVALFFLAALGGITHSLPMMFMFSPLFAGLFATVIICHALRIGRFNGIFVSKSLNEEESDSYGNRMLWALLSIIAFPFVLACFYAAVISWWLIFIPLLVVVLVIAYCWRSCLIKLLRRRINLLLRNWKREENSWLLARKRSTRNKIDDFVMQYKHDINEAVMRTGQQMEAEIETNVDQELSNFRAIMHEPEQEEAFEAFVVKDKEELLKFVRELIDSTESKLLDEVVPRLLESLSASWDRHSEEITALGDKKMVEFQDKLKAVDEVITWAKWICTRRCTSLVESAENSKRKVKLLKSLLREIKQAIKESSDRRGEIMVRLTEDLHTILNKFVDEIDESVEAVRSSVLSELKRRKKKWKEERQRLTGGIELDRLEALAQADDKMYASSLAGEKLLSQLKSTAQQLSSAGEWDNQRVVQRKRHYMFRQLIELLKKFAVYDSLGNVILLCSGVIAVIFVLSVNYGILIYSGVPYVDVFVADFESRDSLSYLKCAFQFKGGFAVGKLCAIVPSSSASKPIF